MGPIGFGCSDIAGLLGKIAASILHALSLSPEPLLTVAHWFWWTGTKHAALYEQLVDILRRWNVHRVAVDCTGVGAGLTSFLARALTPYDRTTRTGVVEPVQYTRTLKSQLGYGFLAAVNANRFKVPFDSTDPSSPQFRLEAQQARYEIQGKDGDGNPVMRWFVPASEGHDDHLNAAALAIHAGRPRSRTTRRETDPGRAGPLRRLPLLSYPRSTLPSNLPTQLLHNKFVVH